MIEVITTVLKSFRITTAGPLDILVRSLSDRCQHVLDIARGELVFRSRSNSLQLLSYIAWRFMLASER